MAPVVRDPGDLGEERFVSLTTFRRSGQGVATPVWVARDGDALVVITPAGSGKVKRLRHDARVQVRPCDRRGRVPDGAPVADGVAAVQADPADVARATAAVAAKYRLEYRVVMAIERVVGRLRGRRGRQDRVALRITLDPAAGPGDRGSR